MHSQVNSLPTCWIPGLIGSHGAATAEEWDQCSAVWKSWSQAQIVAVVLKRYCCRPDNGENQANSSLTTPYRALSYVLSSRFFSIQQFPVNCFGFPVFALENQDRNDCKSMWTMLCFTTFLSYTYMHLVLRIWWNMGESWSIYFWAFGDTLLTNADITDILRTAYLQTPQQRARHFCFASSRAKFGPGSHLTLPRRSLHVQRVQHRKKSAGSCGVFFDVFRLHLAVSQSIKWDTVG